MPLRDFAAAAIGTSITVAHGRRHCHEPELDVPRATVDTAAAEWCAAPGQIADEELVTQYHDARRKWRQCCIAPTYSTKRDAIEAPST